MLITITNEQKVLVTLAPTTEAGNPATVDGVPAWTIESGDAVVEPSEDGMSAYIISGEANVNSVITVMADADLGDGVVNIKDTIDLAVVAASASNLGVVAGTPELK